MEDYREDKVQKICQLLKKEAIDPAKQEASAILQRAKSEAAEILAQAHKEREELLKKFLVEKEGKEKALASSLKIAFKQALEGLRQEIESHFFAKELKAWIEKETSAPKLLAEWISLVIEHMTQTEGEQKQGDLIAFVGKKVPPQKLTALLIKSVLERLDGKSVALGSFESGVKLKSKRGNLTIDLSDEALHELAVRYIRRDIRKALFIDE